MTPRRLADPGARSRTVVDRYRPPTPAPEAWSQGWLHPALDPARPGPIRCLIGVLAAEHVYVRSASAQLILQSDRVEASPFHRLREIEQISQGVAWCEQGLAIIEIDAESDLGRTQRITLKMFTGQESS